MEFKWQQVSSMFQVFSEYTSQSKQYCNIYAFNSSSNF